MYYQRVDVLAKSGEMASFTWRCVLSEDGRWLTDAVVSDHWNDHWACVLAYGEPSPRFSPEAVIQAQLALLRAGDFRTCMAFSIGDVGRAPARLHAAGPNARLERFIALLEGPRHFPLVRHRRATLGTATLKRNKFAQIVHVETTDGFYADFEFVLSLQPNNCWSTQAINRMDYTAGELGQVTEYVIDESTAEQPEAVIWRQEIARIDEDVAIEFADLHSKVKNKVVLATC